ncbi:unnamed protein product [Amoebophrya sp. A25]|nr:unnamed protein product [Amoebophrya sp. A25]|eukprot:GSA25T00001258001.1
MLSWFRRQSMVGLLFYGQHQQPQGGLHGAVPLIQIEKGLVLRRLSERNGRRATDNGFQSQIMDLNVT